MIALFDFDGTLTRKDSFVVFARFAVGRRRLLLALLRTAPHLAAWKLGLCTSSKAKERLFGGLFRGMPYTQFRALGEQFVPHINAMLRPDMMQCLRRHQSQGTPCYILSASIDEWIRPWAMANGLVDVAATLIEVGADGRLTGRFASANCRGQEKITRLAHLRPDYLHHRIAAYGDSPSDAPLLALAEK